MSNEDENRGLPEVGGRKCCCTNKELEMRLRFYIKLELEKLSPDNALIALLSDAVRNTRNFSDRIDNKPYDKWDGKTYTRN